MVSTTAPTTQAGLKRLYPVLISFAICGATYIWASYHQESIALMLYKIFPREADKGLVFYSDFVGLCLNEFLWLCLFALMVWTIATFNLYRVVRPVEYAATRRPLTTAFLTILCSFGLTVTVSLVVLEQFPNSADEYVYLHQAKTLAEGKLWNEVSPIREAFQFNHIAEKEGTRVGRFPPGWPLVLSASFIGAIPSWLVNPILSVVTLVVFFVFARKLYGVRVACWSLLLFSMSGYFIYNSASFFSHTWSLLLVMLIVWMIYNYIRESRPVYVVLAGIALGLLILTRYFTALLVFIPLGLYVVQKFRTRFFVPAFYIFLGALPGILMLAWYNHQITGHPAVPVTAWAYDNEQLGFVNGHNFIQALEHSFRRICMFIYWCSPGILLLYVVFLFGKLLNKTDRWAHPEDYIFIFLLAGHFFYYHIGGNQYGPRFLYEALPFVVLFAVKKAYDSRNKLAWAVVMASLLICVVKLPFISMREAVIVDQRKDLFDLVEKANLNKAVVFVASPTSTIRPMPVEDLLRNDLPVIQGVVFVRELPGLEKKIMEHFSDYAFYRYHREVNNEKGRLVKIID
jgi:hypothetical protein